MVDGAIFLTSRGLAGFTEARSRRGQVFEGYDRVVQVIKSRFGTETANLFAQPVATRDALGKARSVSWYTSCRGNIQTWADLDLDAQAAARSQVAAAMQQLVGMLDDPDVGDDLRRWVNLPSLGDSLHLVGGRAVLVNWGLLPDAAAVSVTERERLFRAGLGSIAPWAELPPLLDDGPALPERPSHQVAGTSAPPASLAVPVPVVETRAHTTRTWMGPAIACVIAALVLLLLLLPGVLRYPDAGPTVSADSTVTAAGVLRTRIADLQGALSEGICRPEALDGGIGSLNVAAGPGGAPSYAPDTSLPPYGEVTAPTSIAPPPTSVAPPATANAQEPQTTTGNVPDGGPGAEASSPTDLVSYLDAATVLVLARSSDAMSTGTGFFVNATDIVTNHHVIEGVGAEFFVASKRLGHPVSATLVAKTASSVPGEADFAVLRIAPTPGTMPLKLANDVPRASNVIAFGFPAFVMESDTEFQCLMSAGAGANADCMPLGSVTMGIVTAIQHGDTGAQLVLHSATISEGNSGGPLVDYCGRAIGVNTFGRRDVERVQQLNFAQHASSLEAFLTANGISYAVETSGCRLIPAEAAVPRAPEANAPLPAAQPGANSAADAVAPAPGGSVTPTQSSPNTDGAPAETPSEAAQPPNAAPGVAGPAASSPAAP